MDGHGLYDIINYHQTIFLPAWFQKEPRVWTEENIEPPVDPSDGGKDVFWYYKESACVANSRQEFRCVPSDQIAVQIIFGCPGLLSACKAIICTVILIQTNICGKQRIN